VPAQSVPREKKVARTQKSKKKKAYALPKKKKGALRLVTHRQLRRKGGENREARKQKTLKSEKGNTLITRKS